MKALGVHFATSLVAATLLGAPQAWAAKPCPNQKAASVQPWPSFCSIPPTPRDVRSPAAFEAAVMDIREAGRRLGEESAPDSFGLPLNGADAFAVSARQEAAAPPPINPLDVTEAEAFAREARAAAAPPSRPH
jgi:hypothetical protein